MDVPVAPVPEARPEPVRGYRWLVLLACGLAMFGNYYVFDALYPVTPMLEKVLGFSGEEIGLLDTASNVAALLTLLVGGVLIDRLGTARSALIFGALGALGSLLIAVLPAVFTGFPAAAMMAGRFVLGVGSERFIVAATTVVGRWFKGREISTALAAQLVVARLGSWAADRSPAFAPGLFGGWQPPLLLAAGLGAAWLVFAGVYAALEANAARQWGVKQSIATEQSAKSPRPWRCPRLGGLTTLPTRWCICPPIHWRGTSPGRRWWLRAGWRDACSGSRKRSIPLQPEGGAES